MTEKYDEELLAYRCERQALEACLTAEQALYQEAVDAIAAYQSARECTNLARGTCEDALGRLVPDRDIVKQRPLTDLPDPRTE